MDLTPNDEQEALRTATVDWLEAHMPLAQARSRSASLWQGMEEMGWLGMTTPALGLDHATEALLFAELGRFLAPVGAISSAVGARWMARSGKLALALGSRILDADATGTALGIWDGKTGLADYEGGDPIPGLDLSTGQIVLAEAPDPRFCEEPLAPLHLQLLAAAYATGCADAACAMASDYALVREQFGKPIGSFQAIKHLCADMAVRAAVARSQLYYAACTLDADDAEAAFHIAAAKRLADQAALENGRTNIQVHGGIGMTDEAMPHLLLKRAHLLQFVAPVDQERLLA